MNKKYFFALVFGLLLSFGGYAQSDSNAHSESKGSFFFSGGVYNGFFPNGPIVPIPNFEIKKLFAVIASGNYEFPMGPGNTAIGLEAGYSSGSRFGGNGGVDFLPFGLNAAYVFPITNFFYAGPRVRIGGLGLLGSDWNKAIFTTGARLEAELRSSNFPFGLFVAGGIDIVPFAPELAILPVVEAGIRFPRGKFKKSGSTDTSKNKEPPAANTEGFKDDLDGQSITVTTTTIVPHPADAAPAATTPVVLPPVTPSPAEVTIAEPTLITPAPAEVIPAEPTPADPGVTAASLEPATIVPQPTETVPVAIVPTEAIPEEPAFVTPGVTAVVPAEPASDEAAPVEVIPDEPAPVVAVPAETNPEEPAFVAPGTAAFAPAEPASDEAAPVAITPDEPVLVSSGVAVVPTAPAPAAPASPPVASPPPVAPASVATQAERPPIQGITGASQAQNISVILEDGRQGILNSIYFEPDTAILIELYRSVLNGVGRRLAADPSLELIIRAYAAYFGTAEGRHTVSSDRAVFSMDYLAAEYGISENRFRTEVYGADRSPKYATEDWQTHRCVELILVRK